MSEWDEYWREYEDVAGEVEPSLHQLFQGNLQRWFAILDRETFVRQYLSGLEAAVDFSEWYSEALKTRGSFVGSGRLVWPLHEGQRLALQLALFRRFAEGTIRPMDFYIAFLGRSTNLNDMVRDLGQQIFRPLARELRRHISRIADGRSLSPEGDELDAEIPAADRSVRLDHNRPEYRVVVDAFGSLEKNVKDANNYDDIQDKSQRLAEISAAGRLIRAARVRVEALVSLIAPTLKYLIRKFADTVVGETAKKLWAALAELFSGLFPGP